jgi:hypothetical protein
MSGELLRFAFGGPMQRGCPPPWAARDITPVDERPWTDMGNVRLQDGLVAAAVLLLITLVFLWAPRIDVPYVSDRLPGVPVGEIGIGCAVLAGALFGLLSTRRATKGDRLR